MAYGPPPNGEMPGRPPRTRQHGDQTLTTRDFPAAPQRCAAKVAHVTFRSHILGYGGSVFAAARCLRDDAAAGRMRDINRVVQRAPGHSVSARTTPRGRNSAFACPGADECRVFADRAAA